MTHLQAGYSLLQQFHTFGFRAYLVGGCVRNLCLQIPITDIDICTNAKPEETMALFTKVIPTGISFGTVTIFWQGYSFEVTTFRVEKAYLDGRHPEMVEFVDDLEEDLKRRDFTINAMAMDQDGNLIDPLNGLEDLRAKRIRSVGSPAERFQEDGLRILRGIRFASTLNFAIEEETWQSILTYKHVLRSVALERIVNEMEKIFLSEGNGIKLLDQAGLLFRLHERTNMEAFRLTRDLDLLWTYLLSHSKPENEIPFLLEFLPLPRKQKQTIEKIMLFFQDSYNNDDELLKLTYRHSLTWVLKLAEYIRISQGKAFTPRERTLLIDRYENLPFPDPNKLILRGDELIRYVGKKPGPWVEEILYQLWEAVNFYHLPNEKGALIQHIEQNKGKWIP